MHEGDLTLSLSVCLSVSLTNTHLYTDIDIHMCVHAPTDYRQ